MLVVAGAAAPAAVATPRVDQLVVFRSGNAKQKTADAHAASVSVGGRRCAVAGATPLASLVNSGVGPLRLRDFASCSKRAADGGGLFVAGIGADRNKGSDGWVYKVGNVLGTAGAADPTGPFGRGRVRAGARVTWFWCHVKQGADGCPRTLGVVRAGASAGTLTVRVRSYDDHGRGRPGSGATVHAGSTTAVAGSDGVARLTLPAGNHRVWAEQPGRIRSFTARMAA
jgi:hypothetical protein